MSRKHILRLLLLPVAALLAQAQVYSTQGDTYISQANPSNNFGNIGTMTVGPLGSPGLGNAALVQVDISRLVALGVTASQIQQATFTVYVHTVGVSGGLDLATLTTPWSEGSATYNTAPTPSGAIQSNVPVSGSNGYVTFDITSVLQGWVTTPSSNNGLQITAALAQPGTQVILDTKESTTTSHPAFIDVVLAATGTVGPTGPMGATGAAGANGAPGSTGPAGAAGVTGTNGAPGSTGPAGAAGATGANGAPGSTGPAGPAGATGANGSTGPAGAAGAPGSTGPAGALGGTGPAGSAGGTGPAGARGAAGPSGPTGANGTNGANGAPGPTGPNGSGGTGIVPLGIPYLVETHNAPVGGLTAPFYVALTGVNMNAALNTANTALAPTACTPGVTINSYAGAAVTWKLFSASVAAGSTTFTLGSQITTTPASCSTTATAGSSCSLAASSNVGAGSFITLQGSGTIPVSAVFTTFSCQ